MAKDVVEHDVVLYQIKIKIHIITLMDNNRRQILFTQRQGRLVQLRAKKKKEVKSRIYF